MSDPRDGEPGHPITSEHLAALGRVTLEYSRLEWSLSALIWELVARDQRVGQTITAPLTFNSRVELLRSLLGLLPSYGVPADIEGLARVLNQATAAAKKRNDIVHALVWIPDGSGGLTYSKLKRGEWTDASADVAALSAVADELRAASNAVSAFHIAHFRPFEQTDRNPMMPDGALYSPMVKAAISWFVQFQLPKQSPSGNRPLDTSPEDG